MADEAVGAARHQARGGLKAAGPRFADLPEQPHGVQHQPQRGQQQRPGNELVPGERLRKPQVQVDHPQRQDGAEGEQARQAVPERQAEGLPGEPQDGGAANDEQDQFGHKISLSLSRPNRF